MSAGDTNPNLDSIIAEYLESVESGEAPDRDELIGQHPDLAADLKSFFANHDQMKQAARSGEETLRPGKPGQWNEALPPAQNAKVDQAATAQNVLADDATLPPTRIADDDATIPPSDTQIGVPELGTSVRYFGDYELLDEIARGGMGVVYKARQVNLNRIVALKMILAGQLAGDDDVHRFYAEAEAAANLDHPGIVPIFEVGEHEGQHYFSMGFVEGESLAEKIKDGPLLAKEAAEYTKKVAEAMAYAHERGVIHRDLKPANVLVDKGNQARVTDFGLAKRTQANADLTGTGQILGTPGYMPPEQASGKREIGPLADVYSLGAILYCLLTGRAPFESENVMNTLIAVLEAEPIPPRQLNDRVPGDLETICLKCLEKRPERRYDGAAELAADLQRFLDHEPIAARPVSQSRRAWHWMRRRPWTVSAALAVVFVSVTCLSYWLVVNNSMQNWRVHYLRARLFAKKGQATFALDELQEAVRIRPDPNLVTVAFEALMNQGKIVSSFPRLGWPEPSRNGQAVLQLGMQEGKFVANVTDMSGRLLFTAEAEFAALSPDGELVAVGKRVNYTSDYELRVYDIASGEQNLEVTRTLRARPGVIFSPNSRFLALFGDEITVWELPSGEVRCEIGRFSGVVAELSFTPDSGQIAARFQSPPKVRFWDVTTGEGRSSFTPHAKSLAADDTRQSFFALHPDGRRLAWLDGSGAIELYDIEHEVLLGEIRLPEESPTLLMKLWFRLLGFGDIEHREKLTGPVVFSPDGAFLAARHAFTPRVCIWRIEDSRLWLALPAASFTVSLTEQLTVVGSHGDAASTVQVWNVPAIRQALEEHDLASCIDLNRDQEVAYLGVDFLFFVACAMALICFPGYARKRSEQNRIVPERLLWLYGYLGVAATVTGAIVLKGAIDRSVWEGTSLWSADYSLGLLLLGPLMAWQAMRHRQFILVGDATWSKDPFRLPSDTQLHRGQVFSTLVGSSILIFLTWILSSSILAELHETSRGRLAIFFDLVDLFVLFMFFLWLVGERPGLSVYRRWGDLATHEAGHRWLCSPDRQLIRLLTFISVFLLLSRDPIANFFRFSDISHSLTCLIMAVASAVGIARTVRFLRESHARGTQPNWLQLGGRIAVVVVLGVVQILFIKHTVSRIRERDLTRLRDEDPQKRAQEIRLLRTRPANLSHAVPSLIDALKDDDSQVREEAVETLGASNPISDDTLVALHGLLSDSERAVSQSAMEMLSELDVSPEQISLQMRIVHNNQFNILSKQLARLGSAAVPQLVSELDDTNPEIRLAAVQLLSVPGSAASSALPELIAATRDANKEVRIAATYTLGRIGVASEDVMEALKAVFQSSESDESEAASKAISQLKTAVVQP